jgi:hypothetical protein
MIGYAQHAELVTKNSTTLIRYSAKVAMSNLKLTNRGIIMHAFVIGDKVQMKQFELEQTDDYTGVTKTGRIIRIKHVQSQVVASVSWSIGPAMSDEYIEDLIYLKDEQHGSSDN